MLAPLVSLVLLALRGVELAVIAVVVAGWIGIGRDNPIVAALRAIVDPLLSLVRPVARIIPGPLDWSPLILLLALDIVRRILGA